MTRALTLALLVSTLALTACDSAGLDPGPDPDPEPQPVTLTLDWDVVFVEGDCEFGASNTGDFEFTVETVSQLSGSTFVVEDTRRNPNTGDSSPMNYPNSTFTVLDNEADDVEVRFTATEYDGLGGNSPDPDMDARTGSVTHSFTGGRWTQLGAQRIRLGSSSSCRVELRYSAASS